MSEKKTTVTDAWDDDWEKQADNPSPAEPVPPKKSGKLSKAKRRAQQAEFNRKLWEEADAERSYNFYDLRASEVPLQTGFQPQIQVLSRKSHHSSAIVNAQSPNKENPDNNNDDESSSDSANKEETMTPEEREERAQKAREEKEKKYKEVRDRLFGTPSSNNPSGSSSPGSTTPPRGSEWNGGRRRGRVSGRERNNIPSSSSGTRKGKQLYDPNFSPKPESMHNRGIESSNAPIRELEPIRAPRGPDGSGRGGFGFSGNRGRGK